MIRKSQNSCCHGSEGMGNDWEGARRELSGMIVMFYILIVVWVTQLYAFIKALAVIHLRFVHFTICKFLLKGKKIMENN